MLAAYRFAAAKEDALISVQRWIDNGGLKGRETSVEGVLETHRRLRRRPPRGTALGVGPRNGRQNSCHCAGQTRNRDVKVGRHIAVSPGAVPRFLARYAAAYVKQLQDFGVLTSLSSRSPWRLVLPATMAHRWLPGLFPAH